MSTSLVRAVVVGVSALGLAACGSGIGLSSATLTTPPPIPGEITQTATRTAVPTPSTTSSTTHATPKATVKAASKPSTKSSTRATTSNSALRKDEQRVTVKQAGITFGAPLELGRADAETLLTMGMQAPQAKELAGRLGLTPTQLKNSVLRQVDTTLIGTAVVMVSHAPAQVIPEDQLLQRQFEYGSGASVQKLAHVKTKAGPAVIVTYRMTVTGATAHGAALMISTDEGLVSISCTTGSADRCKAITNRIVATVKRTG